MANHTFAKFYLSGAEFFNDEASKTIGQAGLSSEVLMNRRKARGRLTEEGKAVIEKVKQHLEKTHNVKVLDVRWDKYCGCSSCPCSPGFRLITDQEYRPYKVLDMWFDSKTSEVIEQWDESKVYMGARGSYRPEQKRTAV